MKNKIYVGLILACVFVSFVMACSKSKDETANPSNDCNTIIDTSAIFTISEENPSFPNGQTALFKYLADNLKYPADAKANAIQGTVYVGFVIEVGGCLTTVQIKRGLGHGCDEEAIRLVQSMPKWISGKEQGKPVRVAYTLPVKFKLN